MEASQLPAKGEGGRVSFGVGASQLWSWVLLLSTFFFWGRGASQLAGGRRGMGASQLWSWVLLLSTFFFWGAGGESASSVWLAQPRLTRVRKCALSGSVLCQEGILSGRNFVRQEFCQKGILSGRGFVRQGFCQAGILSGRNFVREEFCQEGTLSGRNFVRKRALNWMFTRTMSFSF